jgi:hypothetical protein
VLMALFIDPIHQRRKCRRLPAAGWARYRHHPLVEVGGLRSLWLAPSIRHGEWVSVG